MALDTLFQNGKPVEQAWKAVLNYPEKAWPLLSDDEQAAAVARAHATGTMFAFALRQAGLGLSPTYLANMLIPGMGDTANDALREASMDAADMLDNMPRTADEQVETRTA